MGDVSGTVALAWETPETDRVRAVLRATGFATTGDGLVASGLLLRVVEGPNPRLRADPPTSVAAGRDGATSAAAGTAAVAAVDEPGAPRLIAVGLATVDLERALAAVGGLAGHLADDEPLGAHAALPSQPGIVLLEPAKEGRLAATLARNGEGPAVLYLGVGLADPATARLRALGTGIAAGRGPFGPEHLVLVATPAGPHLVLVEDARPT